MARTPEQIVAAMRLRMAAEPSLALFDNQSSAEFFAMLMHLYATEVHEIEKIVDIVNTQLIDQIAATRPGTADWYGQQALKFQYGQVLQVLNGVIGYATDVPAARLVKYVSVEDAVDGSNVPIPGQILIKCAGAAADGTPTALITPVRNGFEDYMKAVRFAGTWLEVRSAAPDTVHVKAAVYYRPQAGIENVKAAVKAAITNYLRAIPFDGWYHETKLVDAIQAIAGVSDVVINDVIITDAVPNPPVSRPRRHRFYAGFAVPDPAFPIDSDPDFQFIAES